MWWLANGTASVCTYRKECNNYALTVAWCFWLAHHNDWCRWFHNYICNNFPRKFSTLFTSPSHLSTFFQHQFFPNFFHLKFLNSFHAFVFHTFPTLFFLIFPPFFLLNFFYIFSWCFPHFPRFYCFPHFTHAILFYIFFTLFFSQFLHTFLMLLFSTFFPHFSHIILFHIFSTHFPCCPYPHSKFSIFLWNNYFFSKNKTSTD